MDFNARRIGNSIENAALFAAAAALIITGHHWYALIAFLYSVLNDFVLGADWVKQGMPRGLERNQKHEH